MLGASGAEADPAGDRGREDGGGGGDPGAAPGWPGGAVGLLLSTVEETLAALDWVLQGGDAALAPPLCQVLSRTHANLKSRMHFTACLAGPQLFMATSRMHAGHWLKMRRDVQTKDSLVKWACLMQVVRTLLSCARQQAAGFTLLDSADGALFLLGTVFQGLLQC